MNKPARRPADSADKKRYFLLVWGALTATFCGVVIPYFVNMGLSWKGPEIPILLLLCSTASLALAIPGYFSRVFLWLACSVTLLIACNLFFRPTPTAMAIVATMTAVGLAIGLHRNPQKTLLVICVFCSVFGLSGSLRPHSYLEPSAHRVVASDKLTPADPESLPSVIHIVLDEFAALSSFEAYLPPGAGDELTAIKQFYALNGFHLPASVNSADTRTIYSLNNIFNGDVNAADTLTQAKPPYSFALTKNALFTLLGERGYQFDILQSNYLDLCRVKNLVRCREYTRAHNFFAAQESSLPLTDNLMLLWNPILSKIEKTLTALFGKAAQQGSHSRTGNLHYYSGRIGAVRILDTVNSDMQGLGRGQYYFAHLIFPHFPYVANPDCSIKRFSQMSAPARHLQNWASISKTDKSQITRSGFSDYWDQIRCTQNRLKEIIASIDSNPKLSDAIVIIHGDHGARMIDKLTHQHGKEATDSLYSDSFSTFFASRNGDLTASSESSESADLSEYLWQLFGEKPKQPIASTR